jgi:hypothetical protein
MKVDEIRDANAETLEIVPVGGSFDPLPVRRSEISLAHGDNEILLRWKQHVIAVAGGDARRQAALESVLENTGPLIAWVAEASAQRASIRVHRFFKELPFEEPIAIGIDDLVLEDLRRRHGIGGTPTEVARELAERVFLEPAAGLLPRAVITGGSRVAPDAFRILGRGIALDVRRVKERLQIDRIVKNAGGENEPRQLLCAPLSFSDLSATGALATSARYALDEAVRASNSYLGVWVKYNAMEREAILRRARRIGALPYESWEPRPDGGFRFHLGTVEDVETRLAALLEDSERLELEAGAEAPTWETLDAPPSQSRADRRVSAPLTKVVGKSVDLRAPDDDEVHARPPASGFLFLSLAGDRPRLARREQAEQRLRNGWMPQLGLLLEGRPAPQARPRRRDPMSDGVRRTFGGEPTERQRKAIEIALNTPDIALIQGPPGTGKTKVITALQRRLAELAEEGAEVSHRVLVTSAQHDAVENVVQRSEVFGLPAVKIGARRGRDSSAIDGVEKFRADRIERLRATLRAPPESERLQRARLIALACLRAPASRAETARRLRELRDLVADLLPATLGDQLDLRITNLGRAAVHGADPEELELRLAAARGIRIEAVSFEDDGPTKARKAIARLKSDLLPEELDFLRRASDWTEALAPAWLEAESHHKTAILERLLATPPEDGPAVDATSQALLVEIIDAVAKRIQESTLGADDVVVAYLDDLENDPRGVQEALERYTVVLAATCQQAAGGAMRAALGVTEGGADFETVIVDEAARANPLDLFIPMSMARRRVILVGDHRQLPHMLEPDVERELSDAVAKGDVSREAEKAVKESLFQRLWEILRRLEDQDGNARTVRLDVQFRMHPVLGDFVSRLFYEQGADGGRIESGGNADDFAHTLDGYTTKGGGAVAAWIDVPGGRGRGERRGRSKSRTAEAKTIADEVRRLLDLAPTLTFGVIAFYADQTKAIFEEFARVGLAEQTDTGEYRIAERWRRTANARGELVERLRIGTVDAFQGREFDVVFLSITRSNDLPGATDEQLRRKYGHLLLDNRLCVAMSRQHRLLVAVGDMSFVRAAQPLVPLRELLTLCEGPHGVIRE